MPLDVEWPFPSIREATKVQALKSKFVLASVGIVSKIWLVSVTGNPESTGMAKFFRSQRGESHTIHVAQLTAIIPEELIINVARETKAVLRLKMIFGLASIADGLVPQTNIKSAKGMFNRRLLDYRNCSVTEWVNTTNVHNREVLHNAVGKRPANQPLVTYSNHHSCVDDPFLGGVLKWRHLVTNNELLRWTPAASDICFTKEIHSKLFSLCKTVPVVRGEGVYQKSMDFLVEKLNSGGWVHTFPEGRVNITHEFMRLKWGLGRLIADSKILPLVIPMWHEGMDDIMPNKKPHYPRIGKKVTLLIGDPVDIKEQLQKLRELKLPPMEIRKQITDRLQEELYVLKEKTQRLHFDTNFITDPSAVVR